MGVGGQRAARLYLRLATLLLATAAVLVLLGWRPTSSWGGIAAVHSMLAGCGVSFLASLVGALPVIRSGGGKPAHSVTTLMGSMLLRLTAAVVLTVIAALQGLFEPKALVLWVGISYLAFLPADLHLALEATRQTAD